MKAIVYEEYGSPDVLEFRDVEKPAPKDDSLTQSPELIRFRYIQIWYNPQCLHSALGYMSPDAFAQRHFESNRESFKSG